MAGFLDFAGQYGDNITNAGLGLGLLGHAFRSPRYSTNIAEVTRPDYGGQEMLLQAGQYNRQRGLDKQRMAQWQAQHQMAQERLGMDRGRYDADMAMQQRQVAAQAEYQDAVKSGNRGRIEAAIAALSPSTQYQANRVKTPEQIAQERGSATFSTDEAIRQAEAAGKIQLRNAPILARENYFATRDARREDQTFSTDEAIRQAQATAKPIVPPAVKAADQAYAKDYVEFIQNVPDIEKNIAQLKIAKGRLDKEKGLTGGTTSYMPDTVRAVVNPRGLDTQEMVQEVAQRNLRLVLGAQFTEKEGERLIARVYNPRLDQKTNAERVGRLLTSIEASYEAKKAAAKYYEENGTMQGYQGPTRITLDTILRDARLDRESEQEEYQEGATATDPKTGQKIIFQGGHWRPVQTGPQVPVR